MWCLQDGTDASAYNLERRFRGTTNPPFSELVWFAVLVEKQVSN